uniref:Cleft lip and palate transmembrane protein 1-like protein n=1 Tax=Magallana gigas TaxID=29159 RepID=K1R4I6_MAGGI
MPGWRPDCLRSSERHPGINKYKKRRFHKTVNLLTGETDVHPDLIQTENRSAFEILNHWHPNLTINLMDDHSPWMKNHVPQPLDEYIEFLPGTDNYQPILYFNDYWNLNTDYMPINQTTPVLNLTITYSPISLFKWQMYAAQGMRNKWYGMLGADFVEESDEDQDSLKTTVLETNPYLLALTVIISIVHSVFEFLAFKNDIQFWKNRKSLEGLSVRSVFFNVFQSLIVVLYVLDNETNFMVKVSVSIGLLIEMWKITKVVTFKIDRENLWFGVIPRVTYEDKSTYTESMTKKYDMMAFKYLSWMLFPLLIGYAIYSLLYLEHKGWYSWVLNMVYGFLLTFGFIMMTPQLFINYKMKSVAHLPWRMMTYKALNTFIDDIFAFVIKMPTLYRIGCFRDDVVFFIFLYQRWIYPIDPTRLNEFGTSQEMLEQNGKVTGDQSETGSEQASIEQSKPEETELPSEKPAKEKKND